MNYQPNVRRSNEKTKTLRLSDRIKSAHEAQYSHFDSTNARQRPNSSAHRKRHRRRLARQQRGSLFGKSTTTLTTHTRAATPGRVGEKTLKYMDDNQKITDFIKGSEEKFKDHALYPDGSIRIGSRKFYFKSRWNSCRNFLGLIAAFDPKTCLSGRLS